MKKQEKLTKLLEEEREKLVGEEGRSGKGLDRVTEIVLNNFGEEDHDELFPFAFKWYEKALAQRRCKK